VNRIGEIVGVLELMNRMRPLTEEDEEFLAGVSVHVGLALENAQLHREIIEKRKIEQELVLARETFVTMLIMVVDPAGKRVHSIRAGHNPPLGITPSGDSLLFDNGGGPAIGLFSNIRYKRGITNVQPGSVLVLCTDGVSEAENITGQQIGLERLATVVSQARLHSASTIHAGIRTAR
jgi:serine phosphatase RsbU (regulator of sigma subunit)